ncbi:MAG: ATP-binding protein [Solirubrobacteraceae bacterium]|nr:ATP-binding protein [Solirubrobacteraceae bacterium]
MGTTRRLGSSELFPTDTPIGPDAMIGRRDDVTRMATALLGGTNLVVAGPRRTGKTSVCDAAVAVCAQEGAYTVAADLFLLPDAAALAEALTLAALANRPVLRAALARAARAAGHAWDALSDAATIRAHQDLGDAGIDLELALVLRRAQAGSAEALRTAVQLLGVIAEADGRRLVLFLDEFQEIAGGRFGDPDAVTKMLRAVLQRAPAVSVVFAGSIEHMMRRLFGPSERALSQFGAFFDLGPIHPDEWRAGLRERLALDGCAIADTALDRLVATGDGHPRATMLLAQHAHAIAVEELRRDLDDAIVAAALPRAMRGEALCHQQTLELIRELGRHAQTLAQRVALGAVLYEGLQPSTAARTMRRLRDAGIVEQDGPRGAWRIGDPLLRRFLAGLPALGRIALDPPGG